MSHPKNVLFLSMEDLNDWIEPLGGHPDALTPNLTRLAKRATVFNAAYAEAPACSPSRTATMFGKHPWTTGVYANNHKSHHAFDHGGGRSLVGQFKAAGFETFGAGKVFHAAPQHFDPSDWTDYNRIALDTFDPISETRKDGRSGENTDFGPTSDDVLQYDDHNTAWILDQINTGDSGKFWALGLYRPHLPFIAPQRCFDRLPDTVSDPIGLGLNRFDADNETLHQPLPKAGQGMANGSRLLRNQLQNHNEYKDFLKAYLACINYADELLGTVLDHMDACNLWDDTLVVLWSDHGWQLGEKLAFRKFTLWERSLRVPLMIAAPHGTAATTQEPVSLTDLAPTLFAQMGLPIPEDFEGQDLSPLLRDPTAQLRGHTAAVWGKGFRSDGPQLAMSSRSRTHRYILYWDGTEELYDHQTDPFEHVNLLKDPLAELSEDLEALREDLQLMLPEDFAEPVRKRPVTHA